MKEKTGDWKVDRTPSSRLINELRYRFKDGCFLNIDVYDAYWDVCYTYKRALHPDASSAKYKKKKDAVKDDQFLQMNARNQMSMAVSHSIVKRIAPGVYVFI